ncbi:MAG: AraC family transcriptional regulator [Clostridia bacterium]|nr:AraC family transcriptional regulator [Clostridia bacterium]
MKKEIRKISYDEELEIEAYSFEGVIQAFPNHFHNHYVIGLIEEGERFLYCKNREYIVGKDCILLFNPNDNHSCTQNDGGTLYYKGLNIPENKMLNLTEEITGKRQLNVFSENVIYNSAIKHYILSLHKMIMKESKEFEKEEILLFLISSLIEQYGQPFDNNISECRREIDLACSFMERHFDEHISLKQLCQCSNLSKSTLLRAFTKSKGVTPYRYLQTIRINKAKVLLEKGISPADAALLTGFSDQSHFTNFFNMFIGISPAAYRNIFTGKETNNE